MAALPSSSRAASCCTTFYEQDWVRELADHGFHPGGVALTRRTVDGMGLQAGQALLDIGCGAASSARLIAAERGLAVAGLDLSLANLACLRSVPENGSIALVQGDAQRLPFRAGSFDAVLCECTVSLFADRAAALREIGRVLVKGGSLGVTDMCVNADLPPEFSEAAAGWACLSGAATPAGYEMDLQRAGFEVRSIVDESQALVELISQLKRKLLLVGAGGIAAGKLPFDLHTVLYWLRRFEAEVRDGTIGYVRLQASQACIS